jgi:hypothetical protein
MARVVLLVAVKVLTVGGLLLAVTHPHWQQFEGKAVTGRLVGYPLALLVVPVVVLLLRRRRHLRYPVLIDLLVSLPFFIDVAGNVADAYDSISWFDDACHFVNWGLLFGAVALALPRWLPATVQLGLVAGLGALVALVWELVEYVTFIHDSPERVTAYTDTLGDMALGTTGALLAGLVVVLRRIGQPGSSPVSS